MTTRQRHLGLADINMHITDDGVGIKEAKLGSKRNGVPTNSGLGFINMQERVDLNAGRMDLKSDQNGTVISIFMPVKYLTPTPSA